MDSEDDAEDCDATANSPNAWVDEWKAYINTNEDVPEGMGIVRWWGVSDCVLFVCVANTCVDEWLSLSYMASTRSRLPCRHGIFSLERASLLLGRHHYFQAS